MLELLVFVVAAASITLNNTGIQKHSSKNLDETPPHPLHHGGCPHIQQCLKAKIKCGYISEQFPLSQVGVASRVGKEGG